MPIPAAMLLGSAWLGREVAAIDGKSYQDARNEDMSGSPSHSDIF
jgi:hypothetical protein